PLVAERPSRERRVPVVIKEGALIVLAAALGLDADVGDAGVFRREIVGEHNQLADGFERGLAAGRLAEDAAAGPLAVEREAGAVALRADELEGAVTHPLSDVRVEVEERIDVAVVA